MMCQGRVTLITNVRLWGGTLGVGEAVCVGDPGVQRNLCAFPSIMP